MLVYIVFCWSPLPSSVGLHNFMKTLRIFPYLSHALFFCCCCFCWYEVLHKLYYLPCGAHFYEPYACPGAFVFACVRVYVCWWRLQAATAHSKRVPTQKLGFEMGKSSTHHYSRLYAILVWQCTLCVCVCVFACMHNNISSVTGSCAVLCIYKHTHTPPGCMMTRVI